MSAVGVVVDGGDLLVYPKITGVLSVGDLSAWAAPLRSSPGFGYVVQFSTPEGDRFAVRASRNELAHLSESINRLLAADDHQLDALVRDAAAQAAGE